MLTWLRLGQNLPRYDGTGVDSAELLTGVLPEGGREGVHLSLVHGPLQNFVLISDRLRPGGYEYENHGRPHAP
jgi:hypothetical protein